MKRTVMAFGSFDIMHPGHLLYLKKARRLGDRLIVVVSRDRSVEMFKRRKPLFGENDRVRMVGSLRIVDKAVLGNRLSRASDRYRILEKYRPNVIVFGYDQKINLKELRGWLMLRGIGARIIRINERANVRLYKSSRLRKLLSV